MMVTKNTEFPLSTNKSIIITLMCIWTYSFLVSIPPVIGWGAFDHSLIYAGCSVKWFDTNNKGVRHVSYVIFIYFFGFIFPGLIILFSYSNIMRTLEQKK